MTVSSPVPDAGTPIFDASGYINPVWHLFFQTLLRRTGGTDGIDANVETRRIKDAEQRLDAADSLSGSLVSVPLRIPFTPQDESVSTHGVQYAPELHALVTQTENGFMSAADKARFDAMADTVTGTWGPTVTFATPGDLAVTYSQQAGTYTKIGSLVVASFSIATSSFTYTTASGDLLMFGLPFPNNSAVQYIGALNFEGLTRIGYTQFIASLFPVSNSIRFVANASGMLSAASDSTTTTSGTNLALVGTIIYQV